MRVLFVTWAWHSHFYPCVQLGWALRAAGHEVVVASQPALTDVIAASGLPAVAVGHDVDVGAMAGRYFSWLMRQERPVEWEEMRAWGVGNVITYKRIAQAMTADTLRFARGWRPDLVVFDPTTYAGPLTAAALGVPAVRHIWGMDYTCRTREFEDEALADMCAELGIGGVETLGDVTVDPCPPSLQVPTPKPVRRLTMRHVPYNGPATVPEWLTRPAPRRRVAVLGSSAVASWGGQEPSLLPHVMAALAGTDVEIVAIGEDPGGGHRLPAGATARLRLVDRLALHLLLPTCSALIHQGGGGAVMTALAAGVPQLILPRFTDHVFNARRVAEAGAARQVFAGDGDPALIRAELDLLLGDDGHLRAAEKLSREMAEQPSAAEVVDRLAGLAGQAAGLATARS
ncbi:nucleotide disphospho-sugar-binding domain-containing protein [Streptosporangium sandarakinum]|uniref:nucleotide disphospho-sugar-binding domain-containing protein n=1 Tax=Streptosporangium sandarakinum TaxID=1260955 RepID=UPI003D8C3E98